MNEDMKFVWVVMEEYRSYEASDILYLCASEKQAIHYLKELTELKEDLFMFAFDEHGASSIKTPGIYDKPVYEVYRHELKGIAKYPGAEFIKLWGVNAWDGGSGTRPPCRWYTRKDVAQSKMYKPSNKKLDSPDALTEIQAMFFDDKWYSITPIDKPVHDPVREEEHKQLLEGALSKLSEQEKKALRKAFSGNK